VAPHDCTGPVVLTASVHLSLNCPSTLVQETVLAFTTGRYRDVLTDLPDMRDGFVYPMAGPGLGTRLQPERLTAADCQRRVTKWRRLACRVATTLFTRGGSAVAPIGIPASQGGCDAHTARNISWC
jgi:Enolase C-terminal domain-like